MATLQKFKFLATQCAAVAGSPTRSPSASPVIHLRRRKTLRMLLSKTHSQNSKSWQNHDVVVAGKAQKVGKNVPGRFKLKDLLLSSPPLMKNERERVMKNIENGKIRVESGKTRALTGSVENNKKFLQESVGNGKTRVLRECFEDGKSVENGNRVLRESVEENGKRVLQERVENVNSGDQSVENGRLGVLFDVENNKKVLPGSDENGNSMVAVKVLQESDQNGKRNLPESVENSKIKLPEAGGRLLVPHGARGLRPLTATLRQRLLRKSFRPVLVGIPE